MFVVSFFLSLIGVFLLNDLENVMNAERILIDRHSNKEIEKGE